MFLADGIFEHLEWWPALLAVPALVAGALALDRRRRRRLESLVSARRQAEICRDLSLQIRRTRLVLVSSALLLTIVALLDPVWGEETRLLERRGIDILVCLDVSRSMLARDLPPSRLARAKRDIEALADHARGDRIGCVAFAGDARLMIPLTNDMDTFRGLIDPVDTTAARRGGTDLGKAIDSAIAAIESQNSEQPSSVGAHEVILLITDGEDLEGQGLAAARRAAEKNITVHCVGFGDTRGSKITISEDGSEAFLKDDRGAEVVSSLDVESLRKIAEATGGEFIRADAMSLPLIELYDKRIVPKAKKAFEALEKSEKKHRFQWPLLAALVLILVDLALTDRRVRSQRSE